MQPLKPSLLNAAGTLQSLRPRRSPASSPRSQSQTTGTVFKEVDPEVQRKVYAKVEDLLLWEGNLFHLLKNSSEHSPDWVCFDENFPAGDTPEEWRWCPDLTSVAYKESSSVCGVGGSGGRAFGS